MYVNIWNNDNGKLELAHQKPILKETFEAMQQKNNFSSLSSPQLSNTIKSVATPQVDVFENIFAPSLGSQTVKPVGGVGNPQLQKGGWKSQNIFQNFFDEPFEV